MPPESGSLDNFFNIAFDETTRAEVRKAASWARICTLCAFIGYGIALIVAGFGHTGTFLSTLITVGIGVLVNYYLYRFATATTKGVDSMDNIKTNEGFNGLRVYFRILGILIIIGLSCLALVMLYFLFR